MGVVALLVVPADLVLELEQLIAFRAQAYFTASIDAKSSVDKDVGLHRAEQWARMAETLQRFREDTPVGNDVRR